MALPTLGDVHVNTALTNVSLAYMQEAKNFVASRVFPTVPVAKQADRYYVFSRADFNRNQMKRRAPGTTAAMTGFRLDNTPSYFAERYSLGFPIPTEIRANSDSVLNPDMNATQFLTQQALINREYNWATKYFADVWTSKYTGGSSASVYGSNTIQYWDTTTTSTPIEDVRHMSTKVALAGGGFRPNKLVLGRDVLDVLLDHPDIIDRLKAGQTPNGPALASLPKLAEIFGVEEVLVMDGVYNTGQEGGTETSVYIGTKHALLVYAPPAPGLMVPSAGYTFAWTGYFGANMEGNRIKSYRFEPTDGDLVEIDAYYDQKLVSADLGGLFYNAIQ